MQRVSTTSNESEKILANKTVAVRIWEWSEWSRQVVRGVQRFAHERPNWRVYVDAGTTGHPYIHMMDTKFDGILTHVAGDVSAWRKLIKRGRIKVVWFTAGIPEALRPIHQVQVDDSKIARTIGQHFLSGGFRQFAYYEKPRPGVNDARREGFLNFANAEGIPVYEYERPITAPAGINMRSLTAWVKQLPKPVGIAAWNIDIARAIVQACKKAQIAMPEQVAIVAWDDDPMLAETLEPTISAAVLPAERLGFEAARKLDSLMNGIPTPDRSLVEPSGVFHVRQSSDLSALKDRETHLALQFIREHAAEPLKVLNVAQMLRISRKKLELDFKRVLGHTPHDAIISARIELARKFLIETHWPTHKVAERSGLGTESTLRRVFLEREGMTPGDYRLKFGST